MTGIPGGMARTLIARYTPTEQTRDYTTITAWRDRPSEEQHLLPSRIGIISRMSESTIRDVLCLLYEGMAKSYLQTHSQSDPARRMRIHEYEGRLHHELQSLIFRFRNNENESLVHTENFLQQLQSLTRRARTSIERLRTDHAETDTNTDMDNNAGTQPDDILADVQFLTYTQGTSHDTYTIFRDLYIYPPPHNVTTRPTRVVKAFQVDVQFCLGNEEEEKDPDDVPECGICWDPVDTNTICTTNCNHHFCVSCVTEQTKTTKTSLMQRMASNEHVPRRERTPKLTCAMCRTQVNTLTTHPANGDDQKFLELGLVLHSVSSTPAPAVTFDNFTDALSLLNELNDVQ